ncbi:hypothetical protein BC826DRAFT_1008735 [Russula brevipes]|nr:hypothetical protein BC826DRAFT_1008735 [Russula brevipes]
MEISDARIDFSAAALGIGTKDGSNQLARLTETRTFKEVFSGTLGNSQTSRCLITPRLKISSKMTSQVEAGQWSNSLMEWFYKPDFWLAPIALTPQFVRIPILTRTAGTIKLVLLSPTFYTPHELSHPTHPPANGFSRQVPLPFSHSLQLRLPSCSLLSPALAAVLTKADCAILTSMVNAAFRLPELSVRYLHRRLLQIPSISPDDIRAEIGIP